MFIFELSIVFNEISYMMCRIINQINRNYSPHLLMQNEKWHEIGKNTTVQKFEVGYVFKKCFRKKSLMHTTAAFI